MQSYELLTLKPITSSCTERYNKSASVQLCHQAITKGPVSRTSVPLDSKWSRFVHPEGQPYFALDHDSSFVIVTEADVNDMRIEAQILACLKLVNKELLHHDIEVPPRCELFLELAHDNLSCNYYFVDHARKALFWLEDLDTQMLGIPTAMSSSHLEKALEQLYWVHVEFFPMHHENHEHEFSQIVDEMYNIISHGLADRLTSSTSTFAYTADKCKQFLELLSRKRGQRLDGYTLCYAARLAGSITEQRFVTLYGQQCAQLDRLQEIYPANAIEHKWAFTFVNLLLLGVPQHYTSLLENLYLNEHIYADHWTHFISLGLADWMSSLSWSFPVLIASILLANVRGGTVSMSMPSVFSCAVSIASASVLHLRHQPLAESTAAIGLQYLRSAKSNTVGFLPSSVAFSLPRASYLWGIGFLIAQFIAVAYYSVGRLVAVVAAFVIATLLGFLLWAIHPEDGCVASPFGWSLAWFFNPISYASREASESMV